MVSTIERDGLCGLSRWHIDELARTDEVGHQKRSRQYTVRLISLAVSKSGPMAVTPTFHLQITINSRHERSYPFRFDSIPLPFHRHFFIVPLSHH
jgi:hypothetical protein